MRSLIESHVGPITLVDKHDSRLMKTISVLVYPLMPDFQTRFVTVLGKTVYFPGDPESYSEDALARILAHEFIHQLDHQRYGLWFLFSYLFFPLPFGRTHRARWERRAYAVDLMFALEEGGAMNVASLETWLRGVFRGPSYGFMWAGRGAAARFLRPMVEEVLTGRLQKREPYRSIHRAWVEQDVLG